MSVFWFFGPFFDYFFFIVQSFKNEISSKILDTQKYNIVRHWFSSKNWIFSIFFKKVLFHRKYTPNFQKIDFSIYPNILYICDQKIGFFRFFLRKFLLTVLHIFYIENTPQIFKKSTFPYTPIYYIFVIRILCSFQQSNY